MSTNNDTTRSGGEGVRHNIILVSQDGEPGYHLHGLFSSFADAADHAAKDEDNEHTPCWIESADRQQWVTARTVWVASRQPIRHTLATTSSPDASPDSGEAYAEIKQAWYDGRASGLASPDFNFEEVEAVWREAVTRILASAAASPASLSGGAEGLGYTRMGSGGRCDWQQLREAVAEAVRGTRETMPFDPTFYPGHQTVEGINYNSLDRIVTAFVDAALHPSPEAPANRQEAEE